MIAAVARSAKIISKPEKRIYTPSEKAIYRMTNGARLARIYGESANIHADFEAQAKADILRLTYRPENIFIARDLLNRQTGELFDGYGTLVEGVCSRVSPSYLTASGRRQRKRILVKVGAVKLLTDQRWRFLTLTMPFLRADVATVFKIQTMALQNFKKNVAVWKRHVQGAFFAEEMVIGDATTMIHTHYHVHVHVLMLGQHIDQWRIADLWTRCVENACRRFGVECLITNLVSNRFVVDIRDVSKYARKKGMTMEKAVEELCKYTTKGSEYEKVPRREIVEIAKALDGRQMIKSYGCFNSQKGKIKEGESTAAPSLDTKCTTDAIARINPKRRQPSMTERGAAMIQEGKRGEWLRWLTVEFQRRRDFRFGQLSFNQPFATFKTLKNERWFGVSARPPQTARPIANQETRIRNNTRNDADLLNAIVERYDGQQSASASGQLREIIHDSAEAFHLIH